MQGIRVRRVLGGLIVSAGALVCAGSAYAVPPPPAFTEILLSNETGWDIGVWITLWPTLPEDPIDPTKYDEVPHQMMVGRLKKNSQTRLTMMQSANGVNAHGPYGISYIDVRASFYDRVNHVFALPKLGGQALSIQAPTDNNGVSWHNGIGRAGYTTYPAPADVPTVTFTYDPLTGNASGEIKARWVWDAMDFSGPVSANPDGVTRQRADFGPYGNPPGGPCPHNGP